MDAVGGLLERWFACVMLLSVGSFVGFIFSSPLIKMPLVKVIICGSQCWSLHLYTAQLPLFLA